MIPHLINGVSIMVYTQKQLLSFYSEIYGLNNTSLALDLGVTRQTIHDWASNRRPMPVIYKKYIALDLSIPSDLLDFDFQPSLPICPLTKQRLLDLPF